MERITESGKALSDAPEAKVPVEKPMNGRAMVAEESNGDVDGLEEGPILLLLTRESQNRSGAQGVEEEERQERPNEGTE